MLSRVAIKERWNKTATKSLEHTVISINLDAYFKTNTLNTLISS